MPQQTNPVETTEKDALKVEEVEEIKEEEDPEVLDGKLLFEEEHDLTTGAKLTFTFKEGLVVQVQPNGDIL